MKEVETAEVISQEAFGGDIYSLWLDAPVTAKTAHAGQFVSVFTNDSSKLLPRPISLCEVDHENGRLRLVYRVTGETAGTKQFSLLTEGETIDILGPLGNGYSEFSKKPILLGGGIGIPPMLELAKEFAGQGLAKEDISVVLGFRDAAFLLDEFEKVATVYLTSDSGNTGIKGNVIDGIHQYDVKGDALYACGPKPMLRAIKAEADAKGIPAWISLEERMACGIGACLGCVTETKDVDDHSKVHNKRICKDGPVFNAEEVVL